MYTEEDIIQNLSTDKISLLIRNKLIFCLDNDTNTSRQMTDFLIYLIQENELMMREHLDLMREHDFYFIRTVEQIEYKTYLSKKIQEKVREKLQRLELIKTDNKSMNKQIRYKVDITRITNRLNFFEKQFREREYKHQQIEEESKKKREKEILRLKEVKEKQQSQEMIKQKKELFEEINKLKYKSYDELEKFMFEHDYTEVDSIIVCLISKMYLKYQHKDFHFEERDLNKIRYHVCNYTRSQEKRTKNKRRLFSSFKIERILRSCEDTSIHNSYLSKLNNDTFTFVDRYNSQDCNSKDYKFEDEEDYEYLRDEVSDTMIEYYLNQK